MNITYMTRYMVKATQPTHNKIAIAFDFDNTLVPDTFSALIKDLGFDVDTFRKEKYESRQQSGWDAISARFFSLIEESRKRSEDEGKVTREYIENFGRQLQPFEDVDEMFGRLRQKAEALAPDIVVEFYLITSGFVEIARNTSLAKHFKAMWGCEFHYSETGEVEFLKRSLSHPEKPRYLYYISKGIDAHNEQNLLFVYEDVPPEKLAIPLPQVIYVGDGTSDIPCFAMLNREGGTAIGVYKEGTPQDWAETYQPSKSQRVMNLAPANYSANSELMRSLSLAVEGICKKIQLKQLSKNK
jgi:phosphoglycolate phosphatase-like HAD superfamily hydrolase